MVYYFYTLVNQAEIYMSDNNFLQLAINVIKSNQDMIHELRNSTDRTLEKFDKEMTWLRAEIEKITRDKK